MEYRKTYCIYHPTEIITNFCRQKKCLLPLCPSCVSIHLKFHSNHGESPDFDNISDTISGVTHQMQGSVSKLEKTKARILSFDQNPRKVESNIKEMLFKAKMQVKDIVDAKFEELQKETLALIDKQNKELGLHSETRIQSMIDKLQSEMETMNTQIMDLRSDRCLSSIINYLNSKQEKVEGVVTEVTQEIEINQQYKIEPSINENIFGDFNTLLSQILKLKFSIPPQKSTTTTTLFQSSNGFNLSCKPTFINSRPASQAPAKVMTEMRKSISSTNISQQQMMNMASQAIQQSFMTNTNKSQQPQQQRFYTPSKYISTSNPSILSSVPTQNASITFSNLGSIKSFANTTEQTPMNVINSFKMDASSGSVGFGKKALNESRGITPHSIQKQSTSRIDKKLGISLETSKAGGKENKEMRPNLYVN